MPKTGQKMPALKNVLLLVTNCTLLAYQNMQFYRDIRLPTFPTYLRENDGRIGAYAQNQLYPVPVSVCHNPCGALKYPSQGYHPAHAPESPIQAISEFGMG